MSYDNAHAKFGHRSKENLRNIARKMGFRLTGKLSSCQACLLEDSKQSKVAKVGTRQSKIPAERLAIDTTGPFPLAHGKISYVVCITDEATGYSKSYFSKDKKEIGKHLKSHLNLVGAIFSSGTTKYLRCDNAGENLHYLTPICQEHNIIMERTPPDSPQYNGKVEQRIRHSWSGCKKLLVAAGLTYAMRCKLWPFAWSVVERMNNLACTDIELWESDRTFRIIDAPIQFGRIGYIFTGKKTKKSLKSAGVRCIMIGYGGDAHSSNTYKVYKPSTDKVVCSKNVRWEDWHGSLVSAPQMNQFDLMASSLGEEDSESDNESDTSSDASENEDSEDDSDSDDSEPDGDNQAPAAANDSEEDSDDDEDDSSAASEEDETEENDSFNHPGTFEGRTRAGQTKIRLASGRTRGAQAKIMAEAAKIAKTAQESHLRSQLMEKFECAMNALSPDPNEPSTWKAEIKNRFKISDLGPIRKHIGVWYEKGEDSHGEYYNLSMDSYCKKFIDSTEELCGSIRRAKTPAYPNKVLGRRASEEPAVKAAEYRSLVGTALYMIKKVAPESSNAVRELTRHLDGPNPGHWKALIRLAGYFKTNRPILKMRPTESFQVVAYTDSNYATDEDDRKSVSGYVVTLGGSIISWGSKKQDTVSLSSCEAEYIASVHCAQEIRYVQQLVEELVGKQAPAKMFGDNNGAIFLSKHSHVGPRTKHIDVRYHYLRELQTEGHLEYLKIKGEDNSSDILTKNVAEKIHLRHGEDIKQGFLQHARDQASKAYGSNSREDDESTVGPKP